MVGIDKIFEEMRVEDFQKLDKFHELSHEAIEAEKVIKDFYGSELEKNAFILVYEYEAFSEYNGYALLSDNWKWNYYDNWWGGRTWEIECTADGIFELLRNTYLAETSKEYYEKYDLLKTPAEHFRRFVQETKAKLNK